MEGCYFQQEGEASERSLYHQKNLSHKIAGLKVLNPYAMIMHTSCHIKFQDIETYVLWLVVKEKYICLDMDSDTLIHLRELQWIQLTFKIWQVLGLQNWNHLKFI